MAPLVSIILPTYNSRGTVRAAINSCLLQSYANLEIIVIDDGSTDGTEDEIRDLIQNLRVRYFKQTNRGRSQARNRGLELARGKYIGFLDSDDLLLPKKIETDIAPLEQDDSIFASISGTRYFENSTGETLRVVNVDRSELVDISKLALGNFIPIQSILLRKTPTRFDPMRSACEDWIFFIEALDGKNVYQTGQMLSEVRVTNQAALPYLARMTKADISIYISNLQTASYRKYRKQLAYLLLKKCLQLAYYRIRIALATRRVQSSS